MIPNYIIINSFSQIQDVLPNSLIVLDIDETILAFEGIDEKWWISNIQREFDKIKDYEEANSITLNKWVDYIKVNKPFVIDQINFFDFISKAKSINCSIIMLTARRPCFSELTVQHIKEAGIDFDSNLIYYSENKGEELNTIVKSNYPNVTNIIFIDDSVKNILSVQNAFDDQKYLVKLYNMQRII